MLSGAVTLGLGAGAIFGNGALASQAMALGIGGEHSEAIAAADRETAPRSETQSNPAQQDGTATILKTLENGTTVLVEYFYGNGGAKATVTYESPDGERTSSSYDGDAAEAAIERFGGPKRNIPDRYVEAELGECDISEETAVLAAIDELTQKYALKQTLLDKFTVTAKFYAAYEDLSAPVWWINLYPADTEEFSETGSYTAILDASTGEALKLLSAADGKG
jgi:hypothetical protein